MGGVLASIAAGPTPIKIDPTLALQRRIQLGDLQAQQMERQAQAQNIQAQVQERQAAFNDQRVLGQAWTDGGGDPDKVVELAAKSGARPAALQAFQEKGAQIAQQRALLGKEQNDLSISHNKSAAEALEPVLQLPQEQRSQAINDWANTAGKKYLPAGDLNNFLQTFNGTDDLTIKRGLATLNYGAEVAKHANELIDAKAKAQTADTAAAREKREQVLQDATLPGAIAETQRKQLITQSMQDALKDPTKGATAIHAAMQGSDPQAEASYTAAWTAAMQGGSPEAAAKIVEAAAQHASGISPAKLKAETDKAVTIAKATAPIKIQVAAGEAQARAAIANPGDDGMDMLAEKLLANQPIPMRNPVMVASAYKRAAQLAKDRGLTAQQAVMEGNAAKANVTALTSVTKQYETLKPFAEMAEKNATVLEQKMKNITDLGTPFLNTPIRELEQKFGGNTNVTAVKAAMMPVQADFARILNSPTGGGVLSDNARHEMQMAMSPGATTGQIKAALDVFRTDARNRKAAYEQQLGELKAKTVVGGPQTQQNTAPQATHRYNPQTGKIEPIQ